MQLKQRPHNLFLLTGLFLILISFFAVNENHTVDIHLHDTYFIIAHAQIFWLFAFLALAAWMLYALTNKLLYSKTLSWIHVIVTILTLTFFVVTLYAGNTFLNLKPPRYYDFSYWNSSGKSMNFNRMLLILIVSFVVGQMIFITNISAGLFRRRF